jgi:hypothetical protein
MFPSLSVFKIWSYVFSLEDLSLSAPNFEKTLKVAIKQGGTAKAAISGVIETIDSIFNHTLFFVTKWSSKGQIVEESKI